MRKLAWGAGLSLAVLLWAAAPAWAGSITVISMPTSAYTGGTTLIAVSGTNDTQVGSVTGGGLTVSFVDTLANGGPLACGGATASCMLIENVPTGWSTWGSPPNTESSTPTVLWSNGVTNITMNLSTPEETFGFEAEPNTYSSDRLTATFWSGSGDTGTDLGSISLLVNGNGGALLFAASDSTPFESVDIADGSYDDLAIAELRFSSQPLNNTPEPASVFLLGTILLVGGWMLSRFIKTESLSDGRL